MEHLLAPPVEIAAPPKIAAVRVALCHLDAVIRLNSPMASEFPARFLRKLTGGRENRPQNALSSEEAAYWLVMTMHRKYTRRVLMALRFLLIEPAARP
ncbi:MAG: hypothetical protein AAB150_10790 [Pseudomonadota bacterium]